MYRYYWEYIDAVSVEDKPSNVYIYDTAYYNKRRPVGVCIALAATIVNVGCYCCGSVTIGQACCLLNMNMNMTYGIPWLDHVFVLL